MTTAGEARVRPVGDEAFLVELPDAAARRRLYAALRGDPPAGVVDIVPAAVTVLLTCRDAVAVPAAVTHVQRLLADGPAEEVPDDGPPTVVPVRYDGEDLAAVAAHLGVSPAEVVARHTGQLWTVEFAGFMPGFGYLSGDSGGLTVPRLSAPRTHVPAGSVALAGDLTGVYPRVSPGGWRLIGTTDAVLWDERRTPPALLVPGTRIRFEARR